MRNMIFVGFNLISAFVLIEACQKAEFGGEKATGIESHVQKSTIETSPLGRLPDSQAVGPKSEKPPEFKPKEISDALKIDPPKALLRAGEQQQFIVTLNSTGKKIAATFEIMGPGAVTNKGSITADGLYQSPKDLAQESEFKIVAMHPENPDLKATAVVTVIPASQVFVRCNNQDMTKFPIVADVYQLAVDTPKLPDFSKLQKKLTVCLDQFNVAPRKFSEGFPGVPNLFEWFCLKTDVILQVPETGAYTFTVNSDDGVRFSIDDALVIDNDGVHPPREASGVVQLKAGEHAVRLDYFQGPRFEIALQLFWQKPGDAQRQIVPVSAFKPGKVKLGP